MADLLSHVLFAFAAFTVAGWAIAWLDRRWVAVGMVGAIIPDLDEVGVVLDDVVISKALGIPFDWGAIASLGGLLLLAAAGALLFEQSGQRRRNPTPGLYVSADRRVVVVAVVLAGAVWLADRYLVSES